MAPIIEMTDYTLAPYGSGHGINAFYFALSSGNVCAVEAQNPDDANNFLRAIATLTQPDEGSYHFRGERINLRSYDDMLRCKPKIGYIAQDAALISNLTVRQNILLKRYYFENDLTIDIDEYLQSVCDTFGITGKLDMRPAELNSVETQIAIVIREISKHPQVLLIDRPEDFIGHLKFDIIVQFFNDWIDKKKPVVFISYDRRLIRRYANRLVIIAKGALNTVDMKKAGDQK